MTWDDEQSKIDEIYYNLLVRGDYASALASISEVMGAHAGSIISVEDNRPIVRAFRNLSDESLQAYAEEYGVDDPLYNVIDQLPTDGPYKLRDWVDMDELVKTDYHAAIHVPDDIGDILGFRIESPVEETAIALYRDPRRLYTGEDFDRAKRLYPHIARCLRLIQKKWSLDEEVYRKFGLSLRESEIVGLLQRGLSYEQICDAERISRNTLKFHMKNIFSKLEVRSLAQLLVRIRR